MPKTYLDGREIKRWWLDGREVSRSYLDGRLVFQKETVIRISAHDHGVTAQSVLNRIQNAYGGAPPAGACIRFVIESGIQLVAANVGECFQLDSSWWNGVLASCQLIIENHGFILGRGGQGGDTGAGWQNAGETGGPAITSQGVPLLVANYGVIAGGGGGSGATGWYDGGSGNYNSTGGGGAPFGSGGPNNSGSNNKWWGSAASFDTPGRSGAGSGGDVPGGNWGEPGGDGLFKKAGGARSAVPGGAAGAAIICNNAAFGWIKRGDIRGTTP
ncbi:hypothetical protein [Aquitalea sp. ASV11]|uniref:hypothetical protein n=1 Tax=Aquitalea sp. ASV11 TaxID=2795103 RepID=UPI0018ED8126|nr:hypothetical protein [Aquitalea sp. ASV11]